MKLMTWKHFLPLSLALVAAVGCRANDSDPAHSIRTVTSAKADSPYPFKYHVEVDMKLIDGIMTATSGKQIDYGDVNSLRKRRKLFRAKVQEWVDAALPSAGIVITADRAEPTGRDRMKRGNLFFAHAYDADGNVLHALDGEDRWVQNRISVRD